MEGAEQEDLVAVVVLQEEGSQVLTVREGTGDLEGVEAVDK